MGTAIMVDDSRLGVGVIGAGKVGSVLALALAGAGHALIGVSAISDQSRSRAETMLPGVPILSPEEIVERSELVLLAVPAEELGALVQGLAQLRRWQMGQLVVHTVAEFGIGVLDPIREFGAIPIAIHPAMVFTGTSIDLSRLNGSHIVVTAAAPFSSIGLALALEMGGQPQLVAEQRRAEYAEIFNRFATGLQELFSNSCVELNQIGVAQPGRVLATLLRSSIDSTLLRFSNYHDYGG